MNNDLTIGKPYKVLIKYTLPLIGGAVFQQLYNIADTIIAGKYAGQVALTAIGTSSSIVSILMAIALGLNAGCSVLAARHFGEKRYSLVKGTVYTAFIAFSTLSLLLLGAGVATCRVILESMQTPAEALEDSITYLNIYYLGIPFLVLYNLGTGIFSALGDSKTPFIFLVFSSLLNILLDRIMVVPWGVAGVAWATFIAQGIACIGTLILMFLRIGKLENEDGGRKIVFSPKILKALIGLSVPVILQNSFVSVGNLIIQVRLNQLATEQGLGITSGFTAGFKLACFCTTCFGTYASGLTNYVSQNYGAKNIDRIKEGFRASLVISSVIAVAMAVICNVFAKELIGLFLDTSENTELAISSGTMYIKMISLFYVVVNIKIDADATVRGCNGIFGFMVSTFSDLILRVAFVYILTPFMGFEGIGYAWDIGWVLGTIIALVFYFTLPCLKKRKTN